MKRTLILLALLIPAPFALAIEPVSSPSPSPNPDSSRLQTLIADKNLRLTLTKIAPACRILRVALLRKDTLMPGYGAFNRPVRIDQTLGRVVTLVLGPEFQPHRYGAGDVRLSCYDAGGKPAGNLANKAVLFLDQSEVLVDVGAAFGAADAQRP